MPRIQIDDNAHKILIEYRENLTDDGIAGADFSDAIRSLKAIAATIKKQGLESEL